MLSLCEIQSIFLPMFWKHVERKGDNPAVMAPRLQDKYLSGAKHNSIALFSEKVACGISIIESFLFLKSY